MIIEIAEILLIWINVDRTNGAWSITSKILLIWTNVARSNITWTNVNLTILTLSGENGK